MLAETPSPVTTNNPATNAANAVRSVEDRLEKLRANVYETINSHYKEYINTYQYCMDLQEEVSVIAEEIDQLVERASDATPDMKEMYGITSDREYQWVKRQLIESQNTAFVLNILAKLHNHLQDFENLVETGELTAAATSVMEMHSMLERLSLAKGNGCDPTIYKLLKDHFLKRRSSLKHRLEELFAFAVVFSRKSNIAELTVTFRPAITFAKKYYDTPITIDDLFASFAIMDMLPQKLEVFIRRLLGEIVILLVRDPTQELTTMHNKLHATLRVGVSVLVGASDSAAGKKTGPIPAADIFNKLLHLGRFLAMHLFRPDSTPVSGITCISVLGRIWWPELWRELKISVLEPSIPDERVMLAKYEAIVESAVDFERDMMVLELIPPDQFLISRFVHDIETIYSRRKRTELLTMAREILLSEDHNTVEVTNATERGGLSISSESKNQSGDAPSDKPGAEKEKGGKEGTEAIESAFKLPTCHVTVQTQTLVELAYQTLTGATQADETGAIELFYSVRDLFDLFRGVVPVHLADALEHVPLRSALFHNDCIYICHHLLMLGFQFKDRLPVPLNQTATFVDMIPPFRKLGETCFRGQMRRQRDTLISTIESAGGFHGTADDERFEMVERVMKKAFFQLNQLAAVWKPALPTELYLKSIGILLDTLLEDVARRVLSLPLIPPSETHQLRYVMSLLEKAEAWYEIKNGIGRNKVVERMPIRKYTRIWDKYWQLAELLEVTSSEFTQRRAAGRLKDFSKEELDKLARALFTDGRDGMEIVIGSGGTGLERGFTTGKRTGKGRA